MKPSYGRVVALAVAGLLMMPVALAAASPQDAAAGFHIVSFKKRITAGARQALMKTGVEIVDYEPFNSYIVWAEDTQLAAARELTFVATVTPLPLERKISPALTTIERALSVVDFTVRSSALKAAIRYISQVGHVLSSGQLDADGRLATVTARVPTHNLADLATARWVMYVNPAPTRVVFEDEMGTLTVAGSIEDGRPAGDYQDWLAKHRLSGKGVTVAVADTGIWDRHPDLQGRVIKAFNYGIPDGMSYDSHSHGTHVAGIVAGAPAGQGVGFEDPDGFAYGQGVAPEAQLVSQNMSPLVRNSDLSGEDWLARLAGDAWESGARIFNGSWSTAEGHRLGYVPDSRRLDELSRNALLDDPDMEELLFVFSAGNEGDDGPSTPHEAKNIVTVGATFGGRGLHWPLESDVDEVAPFSARGPMLDGRNFPTVTAPGVWLPSARPPVHTSPACLGPIDALALYCSKSGTSMAAPHVSGAAALIHQWWKRKHGRLPSPAMVKALLVNSATDTGEADIPNDFEGWGRVNLEHALGSRVYVLDDQSATFHRPGARKTYRIRVRNNDSIKVTLAWSDAPAAVGASPALVNDLDLVLERFHKGKVQDVWRGNNFRNGWSAMHGPSDRLNNVESVFIRKAPAGVYRITVAAFNVPGDGVPGNGSATDQDYSLVATTVGG